MEFKTHKSISDSTNQLLKGSSMKVVCRLGKLLEDRGINQTELSILTGIRQPSINDIIHDKKHTINKQHLLAIMLVLKLTDISELYEVVIEDEGEEARLLEEGFQAEKLGLLDEQLELIKAKRKGLES